ncbi:hypothetical protein ACFQ60_08400 [Streptomyces zhihengii]
MGEITDLLCWERFRVDARENEETQGRTLLSKFKGMIRGTGDRWFVFDALDSPNLTEPARRLIEGLAVAAERRETGGGMRVVLLAYDRALPPSVADTALTEDLRPVRVEDLRSFFVRVAEGIGNSLPDEAVAVLVASVLEEALGDRGDPSAPLPFDLVSRAAADRAAAARREEGPVTERRLTADRIRALLSAPAAGPAAVPEPVPPPGGRTGRRRRCSARSRRGRWARERRSGRGAAGRPGAAGDARVRLRPGQHPRGAPLAADRAGPLGRAGAPADTGADAARRAVRARRPGGHRPCLGAAAADGPGAGAGVVRSRRVARGADRDAVVRLRPGARAALAQHSVDLPEPGEVRGRIELASLLEPLRALVGDRFVGRHHELDMLAAHVGVLPGAAARPGRPRRGARG